MPYLLNVTGALNKYVTCSIPQPAIDTGRALQVEYEDEFEVRRTATDWPLASTSVSAANDLIFLRSGSDVEIRSTGNSNWTVTTGVNLTQFHVFRIRTTFNGTTATRQLYVDGVLKGTTTALSNARMGAIAAFFGLANDATRSGELKYFKRTDFVNSSNNRLYDANASGGTGNILPETINGFNGTQQGAWPSDNSEWVFYSSGASNTITISATLPKITGSLTLNESNPSYVISVNGQLPKITGAVSLNEINPVFTVAVAGQLPKLTGSIALNQFANNRQVTVSGVLPKLTGAVTLNRIQPNNQVAVSGQLPRITASITLRVPDSYPTANPNDYTVSAYLSTDSTYTARLSESSTINAIISASSTINARLN